ncbi:MAG TPA: hypothetical protein DEH02_02950 [Bacteroidales bacterium]|nr:MAG: hypothetical protein A2X01_10075 [Bacteroidetes bacterium GWF2_35_48]OFY97991.1 MAG: hypothetical protein A2491_19100 [Bacteroidetes bacterium RIFOXYC12_FULL_35_7]HBX50006.1 hypothetical protein [Bacteroidales bacterium]
MITRSNYEIWFIDYLDGKLSPFQISQLMLFLKENADLAAELEGMGDTFLVAEQISFEAKESLKEIPQKSLVLNNENFDETCIARIEGDLNTEQKKEFDRYLFTHPEKINDYGLFAKTRLQPDYNIIFDKKSSLKKYKIQKNYRKYLLPAVGIAASVILFIVVYITNNNSKTSNEKQLANVVEIKDTSNSVHKSNNIQNSTTVDVNEKNQSTEKTRKNKLYTEKKLPAQKHIQKFNTPLTDTLNNITNIKKDFIPLEKMKLRKSFIAYTESAGTELELRNATCIFPIIKNEIAEEHPSLAQLAKKQIRKIFMKQEDRLKETSLTFLDVAEAAVRSFNKRTGKNIRIEKTYNDEGSVEVLAFKSENFQFIKPVKK